jgi:uncharacterized protein (TIGR02594 family)
MNEPYIIARRLEGIIKEIPGNMDNHFIQWALSLCDIPEPIHDEIPWCSAGMEAVHLLGGRKGTGSAAARSWLKWGIPIEIADAQEGDIIILKRGGEDQPGPEVLDAPGHVCFFVFFIGDKTWFKGYGGNQMDKYCMANFPVSRVLGVRRFG